MFTVKQAAKMLGISRSKLYQLTNRREISFYKIGGKILFTEEQLQAFLNGCLVEKAGEQKASLPPARREPLQNLILD